MAVGRLLEHSLIQLQLQSQKTTLARTVTTAPSDGKHGEATSLGRLLLEKTLRGHDRWRCLEIQLLMLSQSTVPLGGGPSSLCSSTSCFWARTALPSNMRSS